MSSPKTPHQGGYCEKCATKAQKYKKVQENRIDQADGIYEKIIRDPAFQRVLTRHANKRMLDRAISTQVLINSLDDGLPIEMYTVDGEVHLLIFTAIKEEKKYRPLHIAIKVEKNQKYSIKTIYDPRSQAWKWDESLTQRVCWCKKED
ncbi:MAG: DUF4258 domain-containing protein [Tepidibacillus sp.]